MKTCCLAGIALFCLLGTQEALACRYTVRDSGFVDLGGSSYHLFFYTDGTHDKALASAVNVHQALADTNINAAVINVIDAAGHPAMRFYRSMESASLPAAVLVAPDNRSIRLGKLDMGADVKEQAWALIERASASPKRDEILEKCLDTFCVVLLIEGDDPALNTAARDQTNAAIDRIRGVMHRMAKPVKEPPALVTVSAKERSNEKALLFSLGISAQQADPLPRAVVLYGRGKRMGPLLAGSDISERILFNILAIIGADCECGMDRFLFQGMHIPLRWDEERKAKAAKLLGFDPENPMVKIEMSQILSYGPGYPAPTGALSQPDPFEGDVLFGYSEQEVSFDTKPPDENPDAEEKSGQEKPVAPPQDIEEPGEPQPEEPASSGLSPGKAAVYTLAGLAALALAGCAFLLIRAKMGRGA